LIEEREVRGVLQTMQEDLLGFMWGKFKSVPSVEQKILKIRDVNKLSNLIDSVISANTIDEILTEEWFHNDGKANSINIREYSRIFAVPFH